jgi:hypothetical protein
MKLPVKEIIRQNPDYTEKEVEIYNRQELKFFAALQDRLQPSHLQTAAANRPPHEGGDFHAKVIRVRENRSAGSTIKDRSERCVAARISGCECRARDFCAARDHRTVLASSQLSRYPMRVCVLNYL